MSNLGLHVLAETLARVGDQRLSDARTRLRAGVSTGVRSDIVCVAQHAEAIGDYATAFLDFEAMAYAHALVDDADRLADELLAAEE